MAFDPKTLVPAAQVAAFAKNAGQRTTKQVALANIARMKELHADPKLDGKRNWKTEGDRTAFTIRVNNTALLLETVEINGTKVEVREMSAPTKDFVAALDHYAARIDKGDFDAQLTAMSDKREARTAKMKQTRGAKKTEKTPA